MADTLEAAARLALKHTGKGVWSAHKAVVTGSIDTKGLKSFCVAEVDTHDELPVCAGEAIAAYIAEAHPAVVLALMADRDRWAARVKELESRIGDAALRLQGRALTPEERAARARVERDLQAELGTCELCDSPAAHLVGEETLPLCDDCYEKHKDDGDDLQAEGSDEEAQT